MTRKQRQRAALQNITHAKLMLQTANGLLKGHDCSFYDGYLEWAEYALRGSLKHIKILRKVEEGK